MAFFRNCAAAHMRQETGVVPEHRRLSASTEQLITPEQPWFLKAGEKLPYIWSSASQQYCGSWARPQEMPFLANNPSTHNRFLEGVNSRLIKCWSLRHIRVSKWLDLFVETLLLDWNYCVRAHLLLSMHCYNIIAIRHASSNCYFITSAVHSHHIDWVSHVGFAHARPTLY